MLCPRGPLIALTVLGALVGRAAADEIVFKNGDRLTGTVVRMDDGKLVFKSQVAGEVQVPVKEIASLKTDKPVELRLADDTRMNATLTPEQAGIVRATPVPAPAGSTQPAARTVELAKLQQINPPAPRWQGDILAGGVVARGNASSENVNLAVNVRRRSETDRITGGLSYLYGRQRDPDTGDRITTADNGAIFGRYEYYLTRKLFVFEDVRLERNTVAEIALRSIIGAGPGYQWIETPRLSFQTDAGVVWIHEDFLNDQPSDNHASLRLAWRLEKALTDNLQLLHKVEIFPSLEDFEDYYLNTETGLRAKISGNLFTEWKLQWNYDATPAGTAHNDLRLLMSVGLSF